MLIVQFNLIKQKQKYWIGQYAFSSLWDNRSDTAAEYKSKLSPMGDSSLYTRKSTSVL